MTTTTKKQALVIGAGPSGLVAAKYLLEEQQQQLDGGYQVTVVESSASIGGTFVNKVYDNTRLVSSKTITAFSDFRFGGTNKNSVHQQQHPSAQEYVDYLQAYCDKFDLTDKIRFHCTVLSITDAAPLSTSNNKHHEDEDAAGYIVQLQRNDPFTGKPPVVETRHFHLVAVCTGLHNVPWQPVIENRDKFQGTILHSWQYKDQSIFVNKQDDGDETKQQTRVLIVGSGETAMDIAHRAVTNPHVAEVAMCVRNGLLSIPHQITSTRPLDVFITNLFEHAYEHPWVHALRLRWLLSTLVIRIFLCLTGSSWGFNQWAFPVDTVQRGYHIINKSHAAMSHLNVLPKRKTAWGRFWLWVYGETNLSPIRTFAKTCIRGIDDQNGVTVHFENGQSFDADVIICATGYKQSFPFLDETIRTQFQRESNLAGQVFGHAQDKEDCLPSEHFIVSNRRPRLGFVGFVRPNVGAIPPMAELQVMWWLCNLRGQVQRLDPAPAVPSYLLLGRKYRYGVDYGNYMHRVAEDIGAAPSLVELAQSSRPLQALYTYCMGQAHVPLFRLRGPYKSQVCWDVLFDELWPACVNRGLAENLGLLFMTILSLWMNVAACGLECLWALAIGRRPVLFSRYG